MIVSAVNPNIDDVGVPFDDYLTKPVPGDGLKHTTEQLLLFDRYQELLAEYNTVSKEVDILENSELKSTGEDDVLDEFANRLDHLRTSRRRRKIDRAPRRRARAPHDCRTS